MWRCLELCLGLQAVEQTYDHLGRRARNGEGVIEGTVDDYEVNTSLLK